MISAEVLLRSLVAEPLTTLWKPKENTILSVSNGNAIVATEDSKDGQPVEVAWLQSLLDELAEAGRTNVQVGQRSHRSSFLLAVLTTLPMLTIAEDPPHIVEVDPSYRSTPGILSELERRLAMYGELIAHGGPADVPPARIREIGLYGGASGIWSDGTRTRNVDGPESIAVGLLHTGRHYPDDLSDDALLYHYPSTGRPGGTDRAEVTAVKRTAELRLPVFVVLSHGTARTIRKGWVVTWDDSQQLFLVEFGPLPVRLERGDKIDSTSFSLREDREDTFRKTRSRPNQQRFKIQVIQRYGGRCALCGSEVKEWLHAAHLAGDAERGSNDPRNGLPLCSNHHAAFDRGLLALHPDDGSVYLQGYSAAQLAITVSDLTHLPAMPAPEALRHRWDNRGHGDWALAREGIGPRAVTTRASVAEHHTASR